MLLSEFEDNFSNDIEATPCIGRKEHGSYGGLRSTNKQGREDGTTRREKYVANG